jgi:hypothetical protein
MYRSTAMDSRKMNTAPTTLHVCSRCHKARSQKFHRRQSSTTTELPTTCSRSKCQKMNRSMSDGSPECGYARVTYWVPLPLMSPDLNVLHPCVSEMSAHYTKQPPVFEADSGALSVSGSSLREQAEMQPPPAVCKVTKPWKVC